MVQRVGQAPFITSGPFQEEIQDLERQKRMAELLTQKGMETPQGQIVGGRFVKPSWSQYANQMLSAYLGGAESRDVARQQQELANKLRTQGAQETQGIIQALSGRPAQQQVLGTEVSESMLPQGQTAISDEGTPTLVQPALEAVKPNAGLALARALSAQTPQAQMIGQELLKQALTPQKLTEGESLVLRDLFGTGGYTPIATGGEKKPTEYKEYEKAVEGGFKGSFFDYQQALKRAGATNVQVSTEKSYGQQFGQKLADTDVNLYQSAQKAPEMLANVERTKKLLDDKNVITGFGAQQRLDLARLGSALNIGGKDTKETVANTQQLFANRAQATLDAIRDSGLGAGQGFSNKDREFLEAAKLGNITYDKTTLKRQLDIEENVARATANKWNTRIKNIPQSATGPTGVGPVFITQPKAPTGNIDVRSEADRILQGR